MSRRLTNRLAFALAVFILLVAAFLRARDIMTLPPGLNNTEISSVRIAETIRQGRIELFYDLGQTATQRGQEGLYPTLLTGWTAVAGSGLWGDHTLSFFAGMLALATTYALGKRLYGAPAGLAALALLAVSMFPIILSRAVVAEAFLPLYVSLILLLLARAFPIYGRKPRHEPDVILFAALGFLLGIGFYLHPITFVVALLALLFIAYLVITRQPITRRAFSLTWFALVLLIVIATPYVIASGNQPELAGASRVFDAGLIAPLPSVAAGFAGLFFVGDANPAWNLPGRPLFDLVSGLLLVIGILVALRTWRQPRAMLLILALLLLLPTAILAQPSPRFTRFAPLLPLLVILFGLGVTTLWRSLRGREAQLVAVAALAGLTAFNVQWTARDLFNEWPTRPEMQMAYHARVGALAHHLDQTAGALESVVCTRNPNPPSAPQRLSDTQLLALMLNRPSSLLRYANCASGFIFPNAGEAQQVVFLENDALGNTPPPVRSWLETGTWNGSTALPAYSVVEMQVNAQLTNTLGAFTTTTPVSYAPETQGGYQVAAPPIRFGGNITFLGYVNTWDGTYQPGDLVQVLTYWRVDGVLPTDLRLFTHVQADPAARPAVQNDTIAVLPDTLRPRDVFMQVHYLQLPFTLPIGDYRLSIGAYENNTRTRLNVFDGDQPRGTRLFIGELRVRDE